MLLLILVANVIVLFLLFYGYLDRFCDAVIISFIFFNALIVFVAEGLSIFSQYNVSCCSIVWSLCIVILVVCFRHRLSFTMKKIKDHVVVYGRKTSWLGCLCYIGMGILVIIAIEKALAYPPQNFDSMTYHLPRSFLYWKNESIHNMPFSYKWGLYTGPFSAILMTQLRIFMDGSDYLLNLIQLPAWIIAVLACGQLSKSFRTDGKCKYQTYYKYVSMFLMLTVPIVLFQASTTQCDLLVASFSLITVYLLVKFLQETKDECVRWIYAVAAGLAGGVTLTTKVTGGIILLAAGIYFAVILFKKEGMKKTFISSLLIGICGVSVTAGFWIRNAIDLNGDFLAFGLSFNLGSAVKQPYVMRVFLNIGYLFDSRGQYPSHDAYPYGLHMVFAVVIIVVAILISIVQKDKKLLLYSVLCVGVWVITAASVNYTPCCSRYLLGALFMVFPLAAVELTTLAVWLHKRNTWFSLALNGCVGLFCVWLVYSGVKIQLSDWYMPFPEIRSNKTYEELRTAPYSFKWDEPRDVFLQIIIDNDLLNIGFQEEVIVGEYPILYQLRDSKYQIQYVNAQWGSEYGDKDFIPDCIIYAGSVDEDRNIIYYGNIEYEICTERYAVSSGVVSLYKKTMQNME